MPKDNAENKILPVVITKDWPEELPITEAELELFEQHMLDILITMTQHG